MSSSTSSNPGRTSYGYQNPGKSVSSDDRTVNPLGRNAHSARYGETIHDRTGKLVSEILQEQVHFENFVMGSDATEFVNPVRD